MANTSMWSALSQIQLRESAPYSVSRGFLLRPSINLYNSHRCLNDEAANEQLDIGHHICLQLLDNRLFLAPINPQP
jgi:hypothetical protein